MNYYNENDPKAAAWLRELIKAGHIATGHVDERSIRDVRGDELAGFCQCHFFAGIGGWSYALRLAGWPDDEAVWTGSCPCQPFSVAGQRMGESDERHLWPDFRNLIGKRKPPVIFGEQVASADGRKWLAGVSASLEALAYRFAAADLCAAGLGAPHIRQRLYWVAHSNKRRRNPRGGTEPKGAKLQSGNGQSEQRGGTGGVVLSNGAGRNAGQSASATAGHRSPAESASGAGGMAHARHNAGCAEQREPLQERGGGIRQPSQVMSDGVGNANGSGSQGRNERILECDYQWPPRTPNLVVCCEDGKARRFEPDAFPLADGIPNRVGLLRGYGNSICPQLAAEFIAAAMEALTPSASRPPCP